jgi:beta-lactamase class A
LRGAGDTTADSDRNEPVLNDATPGDIQDTSTALALGTDLRQFLLGHLLSPSRRALLTDWLLHNTTGGPYVRAGVPAGWKVADKTGNGHWGTRNDIADATRIALADLG